MQSLLLWTLLVTSQVLASNVQTSVIDLNERFLEVKDVGFWFVKLYAPWCAHCKRLVPIWEHVGHAIADKELPVRIAKMDCTRFPAVCSTLGVSSYPTLIFFRNGKTIDYDGERKKDAMIDFAIKASSPEVQDVKDMVALNEVREKSRMDPSFFFILEEDGKWDSEEWREAFARAAEVLFSKTRFYQIKRSIVPSQVRDQDSSARIFVLKDDGPVVFSGSVGDLHDWILGERWPLLPQASGSNMADLASSGKQLVLLVLSQLERKNGSSPVGLFYSVGEDAARLVRSDASLRSSYQFAWLDGNDIANSIVLGTVETPGILVFNYSSYEYFPCSDSPQHMTAQSVVTWLKEIKTNDAVPLGGRGVVQRLRRIAYEVYSNVHQMFAAQPLLSTCLFGVPIAFLSIVTYSICSADFTVDRDEVYPDSEFSDEEGEGDEEGEEGGEKDEKAPLVSSHPKAD